MPANLIRFLPALALAALLAHPASAGPIVDAGEAVVAGDAGESGGIVITKDAKTDDDDNDDDDDEPRRPAPPMPPMPPRHHHARKHGNHDDKVSIGSSVEVHTGETVGDAVSIGGSTDVFGHVRGDAVSVGGSLHVHPGGHVDGDAVSVGGTMLIDDGGEVEGERVSAGVAGVSELSGKLGAVASAWEIISSLMATLGLIALGALFVAFMPERMERMKAALVARPLPAIGVGTLVFVGIIPASLVLIVTIVGILVVPFLWLFFALLLVLGMTLAAQLVGERVLRGTHFGGPFGTLAVGAAILAVVKNIPFLGFCVIVMAMLLGVGAALVTRMGQPPPNSGSSSPPMPPIAPMSDLPPEAPMA